MECYELDFIIKESLGSRHVSKRILSLRVKKRASPPLMKKATGFSLLFEKRKNKKRRNSLIIPAVRKLRRSPPLPLFKPSTRAPTMRYYLCTFLTFILLHSSRSSRICVSSRTKETENKKKRKKRKTLKRYDREPSPRP